MNAVKILDVTLRDGGIVNNFNFGEKNMQAVLSALEEAEIKFIELGYLEKNKGTERGRTQYCNEKVIEKYFLTQKKPGVLYFAMIDYGKFDVDTLGVRTETGIDAIRFAFHKRNYWDALPLYNKLIQKGYDVYMQPMVTLHYTEEELKELINSANEMDVKGVYFVDTFGQMQQPDIERLASIFHENLRPDIALGFHSHNNIQMAYANAITFLKMPMDREKMLDSSIMGMGRGAGNLNTELILSHLNLYYGGNYRIAPLLNVMDTVLNTIKAQHPWGYSVEYYLSSVNDCSPIYASHYYNKHMLPVEQINELLGRIKGENRISFNKEYAEEIYRQYNARIPYDDSSMITKLKEIFYDKTVCVLAPGKSLKDEYIKIGDFVGKADITVSLNCNVFNSDYELITRADILEDALAMGKKVIAPSNIAQKQNNNIYIIDYLKWISINEETHDSAGFIILNLLTALETKEIYLAGFDGFDVNINKNYYDEYLQRPVSIEQIHEKNRSFSRFIQDKQQSFKIIMITKSIYENYI